MSEKPVSHAALNRASISFDVSGVDFPEEAAVPLEAVPLSPYAETPNNAPVTVGGLGNNAKRFRPTAEFTPSAFDTTARDITNDFIRQLNAPLSPPNPDELAGC